MGRGWGLAGSLLSWGSLHCDLKQGPSLLYQTWEGRSSKIKKQAAETLRRKRLILGQYLGATWLLSVKTTQDARSMGSRFIIRVIPLIPAVPHSLETLYTDIYSKRIYNLEKGVSFKKSRTRLCSARFLDAPGHIFQWLSCFQADYLYCNEFNYIGREYASSLSPTRIEALPGRVGVLSTALPPEPSLVPGICWALAKYLMKDDVYFLLCFLVFASWLSASPLFCVFPFLHLRSIIPFLKQTAFLRHGGRRCGPNIHQVACFQAAKCKEDIWKTKPQMKQNIPFSFFKENLWRGRSWWTRPHYKDEANCWGSENGYWELTIIVTHYLSLVPEKQFSFSNISVPVKLRKCRIQIPPKGVSLKKFTSSTATGIYGFFFNSCSLIYLFLGSQGRFIYLSFEHFKQIPAL